MRAQPFHPQPSLGLPQSQIDRMTSQQKSTAVLLHSKATTSHESISPEAIIKRLESGKNKDSTVQTLRTSLRSELIEWTVKFLELNGHDHLFEIYLAAFSKGKYANGMGGQSRTKKKHIPKNARINSRPFSLTMFS